MIIKVEARPNVIKANTYSELQSKLPYGLMFSDVGTYRPSWGRYISNDDTVFVFNIRKENRKTRQIKYKSGKKAGQTKKSEIIRKKRWIANVYTFDRALLKAAGLKVEQRRTNFIITKK